MPRTKEQDAEYQRRRRAAKAKAPEVGRRIDTPEQVAKLSIVRPEKPTSDLSQLARELRRPGDDDEMAERRARIASGARSNYIHGDFVAEIQGMTQHQRDAILNRMPKLRKGE